MKNIEYAFWTITIIVWIVQIVISIMNYPDGTPGFRSKKEFKFFLLSLLPYMTIFTMLNNFWESLPDEAENKDSDEE